MHSTYNNIIFNMYLIVKILSFSSMMAISSAFGNNSATLISTGSGEAISEYSESSTLSLTAYNMEEMKGLVGTMQGFVVSLHTFI